MEQTLRVLAVAGIAEAMATAACLAARWSGCALRPLPLAFYAASVGYALVPIGLLNLGIPAFAYGGGRLDISHGPDEYIDEAAMRRCAAVYALFAGPGSPRST